MQTAALIGSFYCGYIISPVRIFCFVNLSHKKELKNDELAFNSNSEARKYDKVSLSFLLSFSLLYEQHNLHLTVIHGREYYLLLRFLIFLFLWVGNQSQYFLVILSKRIDQLAKRPKFLNTIFVQHFKIKLVNSVGGKFTQLLPRNAVTISVSNYSSL